MFKEMMLVITYARLKVRQDTMKNALTSMYWVRSTWIQSNVKVLRHFIEIVLLWWWICTNAHIIIHWLNSVQNLVKRCSITFLLREFRSYKITFFSFSSPFRFLLFWSYFLIKWMFTSQIWYDFYFPEICPVSWLFSRILPDFLQFFRFQ